MLVKRQTATGEMYFNPSQIARVHLSSDHSMITVHFLKGFTFSVSLPYITHNPAGPSRRL